MSELVAPSPADETLAWVEEALAEHAGPLYLTFERLPALAQPGFAGALESRATRLEPQDLPDPVRAVKVGRYTILLALLPEAPDRDAVVEAVRRVRNQCVVARSYLSPAAAMDLHALLVGPRGSEGEERWRPLALLAERDERVARKLVWRRPAASESDPASFDDFCRRTFLARPWKTDAVFSKAPLDHSGRAAEDDGIPRDTAGEWARLAADDELDADALVDALINAWEDRSRA